MGLLCAACHWGCALSFTVKITNSLFFSGNFTQKGCFVNLVYISKFLFPRSRKISRNVDSLTQNLCHAVAIRQWEARH